MNVKINYLDNILPITEDMVTSIEIENKGCFYRTISNFIKMSNGEMIEDIYIFDNETEEVKIFNKLLIISDYFNLDSLLKKYVAHLQKLIIENTEETTINDLAILYKKIIEKIKQTFKNIDFQISFNDEFSLEQLLKIIKPKVDIYDTFIKNLYLIIDLENAFKLNKLLVFVNLKQYLSKEELLEFYKYCLYNKINVLLIDNSTHETTIEHERKLIVDNELDEFMI